MLNDVFFTSMHNFPIDWAPNRMPFGKNKIIINAITIIIQNLNHNPNMNKYMNFF